jgi:hypothetical protein
MKGDDMGFLLGFFMGLLAAIGVIGFLVYWLCSCSNHIAVAKFIDGIAQAMAHRPKASEPSTADANGVAAEESKENEMNREGSRKDGRDLSAAKKHREGNSRAFPPMTGKE